VNKKSIRGPFSILFEATACDRYFSDYDSESGKVGKITISMLNKFTIGLRAKTVLPGYRKSYPRNPEMYPSLTYISRSGCFLVIKCLYLSRFSGYEAHLLHE
jgi:hypothetical protein